MHEDKDEYEEFEGERDELDELDELDAATDPVAENISEFLSVGCPVIAFCTLVNDEEDFDTDRLLEEGEKLFDTIWTRAQGNRNGEVEMTQKDWVILVEGFIRAAAEKLGMQIL
jgi:hypothetical protein